MDQALSTNIITTYFLFRFNYRPIEKTTTAGAALSFNFRFLPPGEDRTPCAQNIISSEVGGVSLDIRRDVHDYSAVFERNGTSIVSIITQAFAFFPYRHVMALVKFEVE